MHRQFGQIVIGGAAIALEILEVSADGRDRFAAHHLGNMSRHVVDVRARWSDEVCL